MPRFDAAVRIAARPDAVFAALTEPRAIREWFPGVRRVSGVTGRLDAPGSTYTLHFAWPVRAECRVVHVDAPALHERSFVTRPSRSPGWARVRIDPDAGASRVELRGDYSLPLGALGRVLDRALARYARRRARAELEGLAAFVERGR